VLFTVNTGFGLNQTPWWQTIGIFAKIFGTAFVPSKLLCDTMWRKLGDYIF
jgi:hypothetical protein